MKAKDNRNEYIRKWRQEKREARLIKNAYLRGWRAARRNG